MNILPGTDMISLASSIAASSQHPIINASIQHFADGELAIKLGTNGNAESVCIVQSTCPPVNDRIIELVLLADAVKRSGFKHISCLMPYAGYSRQDKLRQSHEPLSAQVIANLIQSTSIQHLITVDPHHTSIQNMYHIPVDCISLTDVFAPILDSRDYDVLVSPDYGGVLRAQQLAENLNLELVTVKKYRTKANHCVAKDVDASVLGKRCLLVDDIMDTGGSLIEAAELLMKEGALSIHACITHAVLSNNAEQKIHESPITSIFTTNSIPRHFKSHKFTVVNLAPLLAKVMTD